jgi:hypothetical protein
MAVKRVGIVLPSLGLSGGVNIVLNWAVVLAKAGYHVDIILPPRAGHAAIPFLSEKESRLLNVVSEYDAANQHYQNQIATRWATIAIISGLSADHYAWFMQAYEGQFYPLNSPEQADFDELVASQMNVITTAHWLQEHVRRHYCVEPKQTFCVLSGLDKALWTRVQRRTPKRDGRGVRFLVEGPVSDPRKNTAQTIRLLEGMGLSYQWVGAHVDRSQIGPNCSRVLERVPYHRMPVVYRSADVLVKASNSEGMFGPPLEMFATGGTAVVWDVQGSEEYLSDRHNAYVVPMNSWPRLAEAILELGNCPDRVRALQENALATAEAWPSWDDQSDQIIETIEALVPFGRCSLVRHAAQNRFRYILHSRPLVQLTQLAASEAHRAALAEQKYEQRYEQLTSSRSWRFLLLLQRLRKEVAPDGSRRWRYSLAVGRRLWRAGRRFESAWRLTTRDGRRGKPSPALVPVAQWGGWLSRRKRVETTA